MMWEDRVAFSVLVGVTLDRVTVSSDRTEVEFHASDGRVWLLAHDQDCCENVRVEDITGDLADLVGTPIRVAEESSSRGGDPEPEYPESWTWTFYLLRTDRGDVTFRWLGESNGHYSESVDMYEREPE